MQELTNDKYSHIMLFSIFHIEQYKDIEFMTNKNESTITCLLHHLQGLPRYRYNRPLSRRLDRCDRMIQNESRTQTAAICVCFLRRRVRHNANYVPYVQIRFDLYIRESLASLSIAMAFSR